MEPITNTQDIIDSRDIIKRVDELEEAFDTCPHCGEGILAEESIKTNKCPDCEQELLEDGEKDELETLKSIVDQAEGYGDFEPGEGLIHEDYFTDYCQELCTDVRYLPADLPEFIENNIDWDGVAGEIRQDYTEIDFDGVSYFMRA